MSNYQTLSTFFNRDTNLTRLVNAIWESLNPDYIKQAWLENFFNIDTATGVWLDYWGVIVALPRAVKIPNEDWFGFKDSPFKPFNTYPFWDGSPEANTIMLSDEVYRTAIKAKALANRSGRSVDDIEAILDVIGVTATVQDNRDMTIDLILANVPVDYGLLVYTDALRLRPAAVGFNVQMLSVPIGHISPEATVVIEGQTGQLPVELFVVLSAAGTYPISIEWQTQDGGATVANGDYQAGGGILNFAVGETQKSIIVWVNGDTIIEQDESFYVQLFNPVNATLGVSTGTITITNDDFLVTPLDIIKQAANWTGAELLTTAQRGIMIPTATSQWFPACYHSETGRTYAFNRTDKKLYAYDSNGVQIAVINTSTISQMYFSLAATPTKILLLPYQTSDVSLYLIDTTTHAITNIALGTLSHQLIDLVYNNGFAYACRYNESYPSVFKINLSTNVVTTSTNFNKKFTNILFINGSLYIISAAFSHLGGATYIYKVNPDTLSVQQTYSMSSVNTFVEGRGGGANAGSSARYVNGKIYMLLEERSISPTYPVSLVSFDVSTGGFSRLIHYNSNTIKNASSHIANVGNYIYLIGYDSKLIRWDTTTDTIAEQIVTDYPLPIGETPNGVIATLSNKNNNTSNTTYGLSIAGIIADPQARRQFKIGNGTSNFAALSYDARTLPIYIAPYIEHNAAWWAANPSFVLADGQRGIVIDTGQWKTGNQAGDTWATLPFETIGIL